MTRVGQILVVFITCFSLLFLGFAVTIHATQKNWMDEYDDATTELTDLKKQRATLEKQRDDLKDGLNKTTADYTRIRDSLKSELQELELRYAELRGQYKTARGDAVKFRAQSTLALEESQTRRDEVMQLRDQLDRLRTARETAVTRQFEAEQKRIEVQSQFDIAAEQNKALVERVGQLRSILQSYNLSDLPKDHMQRILANAPAVEGVVLKVDGKYVEISVGGDSGLRRRHKLHVFRIRPAQRYLGKIELVLVDPDHSVGRMLAEFKNGTIQEGDRVASHITGR